MRASSMHTGSSRPRAQRRTRRAMAAALILSLLLAAVALAAKNAPKPGTYEGTSSEKSPVAFKVSSGGTAIQSFKTVIGYNGKCGQGGGPGYTAAAGRIAIRNGSFSITTSFKGPVASVPSKQGKITGKFSGNTVTGTVGIPSLKSKKICLAYVETYRATWKHK
jgi:hypothetical protein